ncbi:phospholipase D-like protein [Frondihabitans sp. PhB188]|uniref:PLDc N-terminal domain-containing protein n=1 Tax=Frondihabitans sp. PhB188 TaxID=2485200 RepID=UPI000FAEF4E1|nr:PLDc N-terminal domain-containing protein [Frondihabitans sp. PhB188]ROQ39706.1 phospholipase D-like protein [Frondihabitans sp. PhB188]
MIAHSLGVLPFLLASALLALDAVALVQIWRDRSSAFGAKALWTLGVVLLPALGGLGWLLNRALGRASGRIDRRAERSS